MYISGWILTESEVDIWQIQKAHQIFHLAAYVTNLGKYNEGYLVGEWVKFPVTPDEMQDVFGV